MARSARQLAACLAALSTAVAGALVTTPATAAPQGTACDQYAAGFVPVLGLDVPAQANWLNQTPPYDLDRTAEVAGGFDRVGYCVELDGPNGPQWVWTAMEPHTSDVSRIGMPTRFGQITRQRVGDVEVRSNVAGVTTGTGLTGYLEMWPNQYGTAGSGQVGGASSSTYDADDSVNTGTNGYGSFQVHTAGADPTSAQQPSTAFAIDGFTQNNPISIGIGAQPAGHPDWTFAGNAPQLTKRRVTVFARPALVRLTAAPQDRQLYPRDTQNGAAVPVTGQVLDPRVKDVHLQVSTAGQTRTYSQKVKDTGGFGFAPRITAGLREYRLALRTSGRGVDRTVAVWTGVVSGDVYVVQGQSNAQSQMYVGSANGEQSPYLRSFGSPTFDRTVSEADRGWHYAHGDVSYQSGSVGQWALRMGRRLVDTYRVPVALLNGAHGGQPIAFFQRNDGSPDDGATNYGRLRQRLVAAGALNKTRGLLWYQGESDNDNAGVHVGGFSTLLDDWRNDLGQVRYYVHQVRTSPCGNSTTIALRDAQRRLADTHGVTVLSTSALDGHDGCHYSYADGYRDLGDHAFRALGRDLYGGPAAGVAAPNPASVSLNGNEVRVTMRTADPLTIEAGAEADFRLAGSTDTVTGVRYEPGALVLTLSGPGTGATAVEYVGHLRSGPGITNATGAGLLTFSEPLR
jgi:carbohydrate esterase-like sialic acid-specific acetylesterase